MTDVTLTYSKKYQYININWTPPEDCVKFFFVRTRPIIRDSDAEWKTHPTVNSYEFKVSDIFPGEKYEIKVHSLKVTTESIPVTLLQMTGKFYQGAWIYLVDFLPFSSIFYKGDIFWTSCLLIMTPKPPSEKGSTLKGKYLLPQFPLGANSSHLK